MVRDEMRRNSRMSFKGISCRHKRRYHGNRRIRLCRTGEAVILNHTSSKIELYKLGDELLPVRMISSMQ
jgi:hypothetical protein